MKIKLNSSLGYDLGIVDVYLNDIHLSRCFEADEEAGIAWVAASSRGEIPDSCFDGGRGKIGELEEVIRVRGAVRIESKRGRADLELFYESFKDRFESIVRVDG